jgi:hypothetical protein
MIFVVAKNIIFFYHDISYYYVKGVDINFCTWLCNLEGISSPIQKNKIMKTLVAMLFAWFSIFNIH